MILFNGKPPRLWRIMIIGVAFWVVTAGAFSAWASEDNEIYQGLKTFADVIEIIQESYVDPVDAKKLVYEAIQGMVSSLDPHSTLMEPEEYEDLRIDTKGKFTGIGVSITMRDGFVTVVSPIEGTPAYKAGLRAGDKILKVDGDPLKGLKEAVKKMRGPKGTSVTVTIMRKEFSEPADYTLVRDVIPIHSVRATTIRPGYGYVWVTHFREETTKDLKKALADLESDNTPLRGLIFDLRDNPGGLLPQAIQMADLFLHKGTILAIKGRLERHTKTYEAHDEKDDVDVPMVVLINGGSASASEIVAGALQDHHRAILLGTTSFGKGSVQTVEALRDGYALKLTIARYYTPSGRSIQAKGITPDIEVAATEINPDQEKSARRRIKEKDLENHLEAEPDAGKGDTVDDTDDTDAPKPAPGHHRSRFGPLSAERLKSDNQIMRALDILVGYDILKSAGGEK